MIPPFLLVCQGHEIAIPIEPLVQSLDIKEEALATLLCYMELEEKLEVYNPINDTCCVKCYGGVNQLRALARRVPVVGMAVALERKKGSYSHFYVLLL